jgi:hypothetical protein
MTFEGRQLSLDKIIIPEVQRTDAEHLLSVASEAQIMMGADSAWFEGRIKDRGTYRQSDLFYMNPVLRLSAVKDDLMKIFDRYSNPFSLRWG